MSDVQKMVLDQSSIYTCSIVVIRIVASVFFQGKFCLTQIKVPVINLTLFRQSFDEGT